MKQMYLTQMEVGQKGTVIEIAGGYHVTRRLEALGIRAGKTIVKAGAHFWRGPVTVRVGGSIIAIGFGMAGKVLVEVEG